MHYKKILVGSTVIEFHNNWLGEETVVVNGQVVSKKSSIMGVAHHFSVLEQGHSIRYVLTTKVDQGLNVFIDLIRDRVILHENIPLLLGNSSNQKQNKFKYGGLSKLKVYNLDGAILDFNKALDESPKDPEIYFHLACAYSVLEQAADGFEALKKAIELQLNNRDSILTHDMLAYLRMHAAFEDFVQSNFTTYDKRKLR